MPALYTIQQFVVISFSNIIDGQICNWWMLYVYVCTHTHTQLKSIIIKQIS